MIKKILTLILIVSLVLKIYPQKYTVGYNLPALAMMNFSVIGESFINENSSVLLGLGLRPRLGINESNYYSNLKAISITPEYRHYFNRINSSGFFLGPYLRFQDLSFGSLYETNDYWSGITINTYDGFYIQELGIGLTLGFRMMLDNFCIDIFAGPRISKYYIELRQYHLPNETSYFFSGSSEDIFGRSIPGLGDVYFETTTYYDKITASPIWPGLRLGFSLNYFLKYSKTNTQNAYEEFYQ